MVKLWASGGRQSEQGFTYLWVLLSIAVLALGLVGVTQVWTTSARREKLVQFEWIGAQFVQAIGSYYQATPGAAKVYPKTIQDLLEDQRYATVRRHLREVYVDPFTGQKNWGLVVTPDGRLLGIRSAIPDDDQNAIREFVYRPGVGWQ